MVKRIILTLVVVVVGLVGVIFGRASMNSPIEISVAPAPTVEIDAAAAAGRLSKAVQIKTVSYHRDQAPESAAFDQLHDLINTSYPLVAAQLKRDVISNHSLLYTWEGSDASLKPAIFLGHMDVVPIEAGTEDKWQQGPFSGAIIDDVVWGRGTMDDKLSVFAILEAAEHQLAAGFKPERTLYFAFGHDEEIGGENGAGKIAAWLKERGVNAAFTIDEGMVVVQGIMPGIDDPIAFIALAEKGYLSVELTARATGGHSSTPSRTTAVGKISRAIAALEANRLPARLQAPAADMLEQLAPHMDLGLKAVITNRWLLEPVLVGQLGKGGATNAMVRTTTAATMISGGTKDNALPSIAKATVNFRILPGDTIDTVLAHIAATVDDPDVTAEVKQGTNPSKISSMTSDAYETIEKTIRETLPDVLVAPGLMLAASDSKHYESVADDNYRFIPLRVQKADLPRFHGTNERVLIDNYTEIIRFYIRLMQNIAG